MNKRWMLALLLGAACLPAWAAQDAPMRFRVFWPCAGSASFCAPQVLAQGRIAPDSAQMLQAFLLAQRGKSPELPPRPVIALDSAGGSLPGAIALGRFIRRQRLPTQAAGEYRQVMPGELARQEVLAPGAQCADACVLAFAGGVARQLGQGARLGWVKGLPAGAGVVAAYWREMGVRPEVAHSPQRWLDIDEASTLGLETARPLAQPWVLATGADGDPVLAAQVRLSQGRYAQWALRREGDQVAVSVRLAFDQRLADAARVRQHPVGRPAQLAFDVDGQWLRVRSAVPWQRVQQGGSPVFTARGTLTEEQARQLARARTLRVDDGLAHAQAEVSLSGPLNVDGLAEGLAELLR